MRLTGKTRKSPIEILCARAVQRNREFTAALLTRDGGSAPYHCLIRNLSPAGAQIRVGATPPVPHDAFLINLGSRLAYHAQIVWQLGTLAGLSFDKSYVINKLLPADLEFLNSMYLEAKSHQDRLRLSWGMYSTSALSNRASPEDL